MDVRCDLLRAVYATMLMELPLDAVRAFWCLNLIETVDERFEEEGTYRFLWNGKGKLPLAYVTRTLRNVEWYVIQLGYTLPEFADRVHDPKRTFTPVLARSLLRILEPFIGFAVRTKDIRGFLLNLLHRIHTYEAPGSIFKVVHREKTGCRHSSVLLLSYDRTFRNRYYVDAEIWAGKSIEHGPTILEIPNYEPARVLADCRTVPMALSGYGAKALLGEGLLLIDGVCFGEEIDFHDFLDLEGIQLDRYDIPATRVVRMTRDFYCPVRRRVVLRKGAVYGAPVYLLSVSYSEVCKAPRRLLSRLVEVSTRGRSDVDEIAHKHNRLLELCGERVEVMFCREREEVSVNGERLVRGTPAKILAKVLDVYTREGRREFGYQELRADPQFMFDPKKPNIDVRLKRLQQSLRKTCPSIAIMIQGKGRFALRNDCEIELVEK